MQPLKGFTVVTLDVKDPQAAVGMYGYSNVLAALRAAEAI